jgi:hypothetical protein
MSQNAFMKSHLNTTRTEMSFEMLFGYACVSTDDQWLDLQHDALIRAGVERDRIFEDKLSVRAVNAASEGRFSTKSRHQNVSEEFHDEKWSVRQRVEACPNRWRSVSSGIGGEGRRVSLLCDEC